MLRRYLPMEGKEREREEAGDAWRSWTREYSLQRGSFLANFSSLSLSLSVDGQEAF